MKKAILIAGTLFAHSTFAQLYTPSGTTQSTTNSSSNNVGVGTNNPLAPLDVRGRILINPELPVWGVGIKGYSTYWSRGYNFLNSDGTIRIGGFGAVGPKDGVDNYYIGKEWNDNTARFYPGDNRSIFYGSVGVGTENPQYKLDVQGIISTQNSTNEGGAIVLDNSIKTSPNTAKKWIIYNMTGPYGNSLQFWNYSADGAMYGSRLKISDDGNMALYGKFEAKEVKVSLIPTADFVFEEDYNLPKLEDVERHIKEKKHLPEIASAKVMEKEGVNVGEFQIKLLQKIEELTLYSIEQNKHIKKLEDENKNLQRQSEKIEKLEKQLEQILSERK